MRDWVKKTLGEVCRFRGGGAFPLSQQGSKSGDIPFIKVSDLSLSGNEKYLDCSNNWVSNSQITEMNSGLVQVGSTVFAKIGEGLKAERLRITSRPTAIDNNLMSATAITGHIDPHYLYYLLSTVHLASWAQGSALPFLRQKDLEMIPILIPPLLEQKRIVEVLGSLDDLIKANQSSIKKCELLAQTIAYSATKTTRLGELASDAKTSTQAPSGLTDHYSLPAFDDHRTPQRVIGSLIKSNKLIVTNASVLIARLNPHIPRVWMVYPSPEVLSAASTEFVPIEGTSVSSEEIWAACSDSRFISQMQSLVTGTTGSHQRVDKSAVLNLKIPNLLELPSSHRAAISELVLESYRANQQVRELVRTRDELLPLLLSGAITVKEAAA